MQNNQSDTSNTLFHGVKMSKHFFKDKYLHISGVDGKGSIFSSKRGFYDFDQFNVKDIIESLFDCLTDIQKENLISQLMERRNGKQ